MKASTQSIHRTSHTQLEVNYEDAFELTGHGFFNYVVLAACSLIFMHALIEMVAIAYILDPALCDLNLTVSEKSYIGSATFIGIILTSICWGSICDRWGRRNVMLPALIGTVISSFASSMCTTFWPMFLLRFLTGTLVSASCATVLVYLGELHIEEHRDTAISWAVTSVAIAFCVVPGIAWAIIPGKWSWIITETYKIKPWRVFMWTWGVIGLSGAFMLFILPESPRYILAAKGPHKALPILKKMYAWNHRKERMEFPVTSMTTTSTTLHSSDAGLKSTLKDMLQLVKPPMLRCFLLTHYAMFMVYLLANGIYLWMPGIFSAIGKDITLTSSVCALIQSTPEGEDKTVARFTIYAEEYAGGTGMDCKTAEIKSVTYIMSIFMELIFLVPFLIITVIIHNYSKLILYATVMIPCAIFLASSVLVPQVLVSGGILLTLGLCSGSCASILTALAVDAFPTSLRALAMCTMYMMGQVGAVVGNTLVSLSVQGPCEILFIFQAALAAGSAVLLILFWPNLDQVRTEMEDRGFTY